MGNLNIQKIRKFSSWKSTKLTSCFSAFALVEERILEVEALEQLHQQSHVLRAHAHQLSLQGEDEYVW